MRSLLGGRVVRMGVALFRGRPPEPWSRDRVRMQPPDENWSPRSNDLILNRV